MEKVREEYMTHTGLDICCTAERFILNDAKNIFLNTAREVCKQRNCEFIYRSCYDSIVRWLADSGRKGLLLYGNCGTGKTMIARNILPLIFLEHHNKVMHVYDAIELTQVTDEVKMYRLKVIDDLGTESNAKVYGQERFAFDEVIDDCEKNGKLLIVTTNLTAEQLKDKYGTRVYDRIIGNMSRVLFQGESFRNSPKFETKRKS